jgi:hypothetical protein
MGRRQHREGSVESQSIILLEPANSEPDPSVREKTPDPQSRLMNLFGELIDCRHGAIGRVVASEKEPSGAHQFYFWAGEDQRSLDVGHIVVSFSEDAAVIGVVDEPRRYSDLRSFLDDFFERHVEEAMESEPPSRRPEILVFRVNVLRTNHERPDVDSHRPVVAGPVYYATTEAIDFALGRFEFDGAPIAALLHTNGNCERDPDGASRIDDMGRPVFQRAPIWLDENYLLGPEAGHANWTGQSGLATKTSHAEFLTSAVFQRMRKEGKTVAALMFNVKGADLLWLDKPAIPDPEMAAIYERAGFKPLSTQDREAYEAMGLIVEPFSNVRIFAPFKPGQQPMGESTVHLGSENYQARLNSLRDDGAERHCVYPVLWGLKPLLFMPHKIFDRSDLDDKMFGLVADLRDSQNVESLIQLRMLFAEILDSAEGSSDGTWKGHHKFTILKARNRFNNLESKFHGLLTDGVVDTGNLPRVDGEFTDQEVRVVDISQCNSNVQELLVTSVINRLWRMAEEQNLGVGKLIVFVDELNKYAPGGGEGALRDTLVDIAARGRHLNVVLFGAQQFRSKVDDEILGNCGTSFYGRIGDEEITNSSYRSLSETTKAELLGLPKGRLLVRHAHFRAPLFGTFPRPPVISGMEGQKVFNGEADRAARDSYDADAIYLLIRRLDRGENVTLGMVRTEADGLSKEAINRICAISEQGWRSRQGTTAAARITLWTLIKNNIRQARLSQNLS